MALIVTGEHLVNQCWNKLVDSISSGILKFIFSYSNMGKIMDLRNVIAYYSVKVNFPFSE